MIILAPLIKKYSNNLLSPRIAVQGNMLVKSMIKQYFKGLYSRTMQKAYSRAHDEIVFALKDGGACLDCGASVGDKFDLLHERLGLDAGRYQGIEWSENLVQIARNNGLNVIQGDLNKGLQYMDNSYKCIFGLSVLEHLLNPCKYLRECYRCLDDGGTFVVLTPNISTYFTAALILAGKMPSSGPHPDSDALLKREELFKVSHDSLQHDAESDTPVHRHLVVFSFRVLKSYLHMLGFKEVKGYGYGLYPFPNFMQGVLEKVDPYHCHQMVFVARK
jgi:2-polyprenyl-3-methyl-5-hydroxy-6-metoxy-1,4-benzoquinol methylase